MHPTTGLHPATPAGPATLTLDGRGIATLAAELQRLEQQHRPRRTIAAIAGVPGSGKSTLARALCIHLNRAEPGSAALLELDGFHLTTDALQRRGETARKGAPHTFDALGYFKVLARVAQRGTSLETPVYDRACHEPVYSGRSEYRITPQTRYILTEGNYLLLDELPWTAIDELASVRWYLETPAKQAEAWLVRRHMAVGRSIEEAHQRVAENDLLNAQRVNQHSRHADRVLQWPASALDAGSADG
jgi:pantothenate kinase